MIWKSTGFPIGNTSTYIHGGNFPASYVRKNRSCIYVENPKCFMKASQLLLILSYFFSWIFIVVRPSLPGKNRALLRNPPGSSSVCSTTSVSLGCGAHIGKRHWHWHCPAHLNLAVLKMTISPGKTYENLCQQR